MIKNGGYTMLDLATATYKDAAAAFNANKPIMVYDNSQVYYADTCVYDGDNDAYILTKGGKTITIDSSNNVVSSGDIQEKLHLYQIDISGKVGGDNIQFFMNIYSTKNLSTGALSKDDIATIDELNNYTETFMRDCNNNIKTIATYENLFVDNDALEFDFYDDEGESSFATATTQVSITKIF